MIVMFIGKEQSYFKEIIILHEKINILQYHPQINITLWVISPSRTEYCRIQEISPSRLGTLANPGNIILSTRNIAESRIYHPLCLSYANYSKKSAVSSALCVMTYWGKFTVTKYCYNIYIFLFTTIRMSFSIIIKICCLWWWVLW
jgi:hypothetical protein